jgi:hypothetical protein
VTSRSLSLLLALGVACTTNHAVETNGRDRPSADPAVRVELLAHAWFQTSATITYDTLAHAPGTIPAHQCIRQAFSGWSEIETAIATCSPSGEMHLTWDPPDRWRMDIRSPIDAYTLLSMPEGAARCEGTGRDLGRCTRRPTSRVATDSPFRWVLADPDRLLAQIGAKGEVRISSARDRTIAGIDAECFWASGVSDQEAGWCYSSTGLLLFLMTRTSDGWSATLEARRVAMRVSDEGLSSPI